MRIWALSLAVFLAGPVAALEARGPSLAAASNFGQGWLGRLFHVVVAAGVRDFRDAVYWDRVEQGGRFVFDTDETTWPDQLPGAGATMSLTVNNGHPDHDGGVTPFSEAGVAAFARSAAEIVARFPAIDAVEVGNEFNAANFVTGPLAEGSLADRAEGYLALLKATHAAVKEANPEVRILGGALHSVPLGYLGPLIEAGAAAHMDALALHPYTTAPEQLVRQIALLRDLPGLADMPLEVTEFGDPNPATAPHHLLKSYCAFALSGVTRAAWYPLHPRGDGLAPLFTRRGGITDVGRAFVRLQDLAGLPVRDVSPDPFTYACAFGQEALVIWGQHARLTLAPGLHAEDALGQRVDPVVDAQRPLLITGDGPVAFGETVTLGGRDWPVLADSFDQFSYGGQGGFEVFARRRGRDLPLVVKPGQERNATFWTPYLGLADDAGLRVTADQLLPSGGGARATEIVHRYVHRGPNLDTVRLMGSVTAPERSADGVVLRVSLNGAPLVDRTDWAHVVDLTLPGGLTEGDRLAITVGPGAGAQGDLARYRFTLRRAAS